MKVFKFSLYFAVLSLCVLMIANHSANADSGFKDRAAILEVNQQFMDAIAAGDGEAVAELYTDDATLFAPGLDPLVGRVAIAEFFQGAISAGVTLAVLVTDELKIFNVPKFGKSAYEVGNYQLLAGENGEILVDEGPYIVIWKKASGQWMLHRDIFNSSLP